jgi:peroxiredoxin
MERILSLMIRRRLLILAMTGMLIIGTGGCSSATHSISPAPTGTPTLYPSLTAPPRAPRVGDVAPNFALSTLDGTRAVQLSDFHGQAVLLFFWAITCSPCVKELPVIQKFYVQQQAVGKQIVVLGVDLDRVGDFVKVATAQQHLGLTYPILVDDHFQARSSYQITDVPLAYFLDRQHLIRSIVPGPLSETILLKEAGSIER